MLRISVIAGLIAGIALSPGLWLSSRFYPLTPVWSFIRPSGSPMEYVIFSALIVMLIAVAVAPRRGLVMALFALLAWVALQDQSRWQPWFYQYAVMLLVIAIAGRHRPSAALNSCCLIVAATYIWSGVAKLNPNFMGDTFPWLLAPLIGTSSATAQWLARHLACAAPILECAAGIGLLTRRWRHAAVFGAIAMHVFILIVIGPLGRRYNVVVWPWNLAMIAFLLILFFRRRDQPAPLDIIWGRGLAQKFAFVLFGVMPALNWFNLWDHDLSSALYSGNRNSATVYLSDAVFDRLPEAIQDHVYVGEPNRSELDIDDWSFGEMNVPAYPEVRIYRNVARSICGYAPDGSGVELVVQGKLALFQGNRRLVCHCSDLEPSQPIGVER